MWRLSLLLVLALGHASAGPWQAVAPTLSALLRHCSTPPNSLLPCLQMKAAVGLERMGRADRVSIMEGVVLERTSPWSPQQDRQAEPGDLLWDRATDFLASHKLSLSLPVDPSADLQEGRGKTKRMLTTMLLAGMMKAAAMIPIKLGALFLVAGKALLVSKLALVLTLVLVANKLLQEHKEAQSAAPPSAPSSWARHSLPYRAHRP